MLHSIATMMDRGNPLLTAFRRVPNSQKLHVLDSFCDVCGTFLAASSYSSVLDRAESQHSCPESGCNLGTMEMESSQIWSSGLYSTRRKDSSGESFNQSGGDHPGPTYVLRQYE